MDVYQIVLALHNVIRWLALILGILAAVKAFLGWIQDSEWTKLDRKFGLFFTIALDIQLLLGLLLYFALSPITTSAVRDLSTVMGNPGIRFYAIEHAIMMLLAVVFAHLGSALPKRVDESQAKHCRAAIWFTLSFLVMLVGMPWMRPLFPAF
jgi:cbb3-type cytochrome oxidase subunit 1